MDKILVVDDNKLIRESAGKVLNNSGHQVFLASNVDECLHILKKEEVDVLLIDIFMPEKSGFDAVPEIRAIDKNVVIIIMTSHSSVDTAINAIRVGAYDYLKKPFHEDELLHAVNMALERSLLLHDNITLIENLKKRVSELELFKEVSTAISSMFEMKTLLERIMKISSATIGAEACSVLLLDKETGELTFEVALGEKGEEVKEFRIKPGQGIAGWVLSNGEAIIVNDVKNDDRFYKGPDKKTGFTTKSIMAAPLYDKTEIIGVIEVINKLEGEDFDERDRATLITMSGQIAVALKNAQLISDLDDLFMGTIKALSSAVDAKSPWTAGHSERVTKYAILLGREMGLSKDEINSLEFAGILHDIGKIGTNEAILDKPDKLTDDEYCAIKRHPVRGAELMGHIKHLDHLIPIVRHHHEHFNGNGYPDRLEGEEIPLLARILAIADTFDAMKADRPYRKGRTMEFIIEEFKRSSGSQFDPRIIDSLLSLIEKGSHNNIDKVNLTGIATYYAKQEVLPLS